VTEEKGGKSREIPVRRDLQEILLDYLKATKLLDATKDDRIFRSAIGKMRLLTKRAIRVNDICRMMKRRLHAAGLPDGLSPHSVRVTTSPTCWSREWRSRTSNARRPATPIPRVALYEIPRQTWCYGSELQV
jgi:integrase